MDDDFGVAAGPEDVSALLEVVPQLAVVVDLAVEDDPDRAVFVGHRLMPALEVDDAQPAHAERDAVSEIHALIVRAAVHDGRAHVADLVLGYRRAVPADDSSNAAHRTRALPGGRGAREQDG